jgi:serine protease AprX
MKTTIALICMAVLLLYQSVRCQTYTRYKIVFTDKNGTPYSLDQPSAFLSSRAILRRQRQDISIDSTDLPLVPGYVDSVMAAGDVILLNHCNWLNQVIIQTTDPTALAKIRTFPFVKSSDSVALRTAAPHQLAPLDKYRFETTGQDSRDISFLRTADLNYGASYKQIHIHHGDFLHTKGFLGQGMLIAMLDAGFIDINTNPALDSLFSQNRLIYTWNFVYDTSYVFGYHWHGANCLSIIAANLPGQMIGSAPDASFMLMVTEDVRTEQPIEEDNWAAGAQLADSAGADIISSSLGYSLFDNPAFDLTYSDLNGKVADISLAAGLAVKKGMIVVNAAGNEGQTPWKYIVTPADGINVLAVGAEDAQGNIAPFSSYGPTADGRISPLVTSVGWNTVLVDTSGMVTTGSGTSYATPNLAGLVSCLWQAFPGMTNYQIMSAVEKSSDHYLDPWEQIGYGLPNFEAAYDSLEQLQQDSANKQVFTILAGATLKAFPNPFRQDVGIAFKSSVTGETSFILYDALGRTVYAQTLQVTAGSFYLIHWNLPGLATGLYYLRVSTGTVTQSLKLIRSR